MKEIALVEHTVAGNTDEYLILIRRALRVIIVYTYNHPFKISQRAADRVFMLHSRRERCCESVGLPSPQRGFAVFLVTCTPRRVNALILYCTGHVSKATQGYQAPGASTRQRWQG